MSTKRISSIEMLRIISMIMIVTYHYAIHGALSENVDFTLNKYLLDSLCIFGKWGVNIFVLISGYFMCPQKVTIRKIVLIVC